MARNKSSLVSRFAASSAVLAATIVVLAIVFFFALHSDFFRGAIDSTLRGYSLNLAQDIWEHPERAHCQEIARGHRLGIVVAAPNERFAFAPDGRAVEPEELLKLGRRYFRVDATGPDGREVTFFWDMVVFARAHVPLLIALVVFLMAAIGVTYAFQLAHLRPLQWLRAGVEAVAKGDFNTRVPVVREDEIGQVARAFNQMTGRIEQMIADRERLLGDVSHELRSPLARIKVALELLPESDKREKIGKDVREMESLVAVLLEREHLRARVDRLATASVDLAAVTREVVEAFRGRGPGVVLVEPAAPVEIAADAALIRVLVQNLVDNAVKFSRPDSRPVEVSLRASRDAVELTVDDDGPGIPAAEAERVFEPFVKLDPARGHHSGYGLGLNLCQRIVEAHGGSIEIAAAGARGARVRVTLPRAGAAAGRARDAL